MSLQARTYLYEKNIPELFESLMSALLLHKPEDHISFLEECLEEARKLTRQGELRWDTFHNLNQADNRGTSCPRNVFAPTKPLPPIDTPEIPPTNITRLAQISSDGGEESIHTNVVDNKPIVFVLGGPGSGKGTQCSRIVEEFGFVHLSAGDLLRQEVAKGTEQGQRLQETMMQGKLVPAAVTVGLLKDGMLSCSSTEGFLIDGFPRELSQGALFMQQVRDCSLVLMFECSEEVMVERLMERGRTSGRGDDNQQTIQKRLHTFKQATLPVVEHYQQMDKLRKIDADRPIDEVYADVRELFRELTSSTPT